MSALKPVALVLAGLFASGTIHAEDSLTFIEIPENWQSTEGYGMSADGSVVVGSGYSNLGEQAFRWTEDGFVGLGDLEGGDFSSYAYGVSADGAVVVGQGSTSNGSQAFRWTAEDGMVGLGGYYSSAKAVSADGSVVVGNTSVNNNSQAFRWTEDDGMVTLDYFAEGDYYAAANDVSADGSVVVGHSSSYYFSSAVIWKQDGSMVHLGVLPDGSYGGSANAVSADGTVVVGSSHNGIDYNNEAFRWTAEGGMVGLGMLDTATSGYATDVSADGAVVVGSNYTPDGDVAFRWTPDGGMVSVVDWLASAGVDTTGIARVRKATAVSDDGYTLLGNSQSASYVATAFIARAGAPEASGIVVLEDLSQSMSQAHSTSSQMASLTGVMLNGAHHRTLSDMAVGNGRNCAWVSGDLGANWGQQRGASGLAEVGVCRDLSEQGIRIGAGVGASFANLRLANEGRNKLAGQYAVAELDWQMPDSPLLLSVLGSYGQWDAELTRGYAVAGTTTSEGETDINAYALRTRLDWQDAFNIGQMSVSPRIAYTALHTKIDGYQEQGGSAPANFQDQSHRGQELRLGLTGEYPFNHKTTLLGHLEAVHRFDSNAASISANINALGAGVGFSQAGNAIEQNWGRLGAEVNYQLTANSRISASSFIATAGEDADATAATSVQFAF
ncbi:MAG: putative HAF family extracellular repeat protein [Motiliproteus sp.]|jgi:probable HAF family extracellular repeat protein